MVSHPGLIFFLLWMVSHPGQSSFCGWCPILVNLLFVDGVPSWSRHQKLQEEEGISVKRYILNLALQDPGHGTRNARGVPLQVYINIYVYILTSKSVLQSSTELAHVGYLYIYIYIYSVLCTSCCVVFYNVPPLMGQVLGKVLLTCF